MKLQTDMFGGKQDRKKGEAKVTYFISKSFL